MQERQADNFKIRENSNSVEVLQSKFVSFQDQFRRFEDQVLVTPKKLEKDAGTAANKEKVFFLTCS